MSKTGPRKTRQRISKKGEPPVAELGQVLDKWLLTRDDASDPEAGPEQHEQQMETEVLDAQQTKRLQIIDTSITLFSKFGYEAVKVSDITSALQMGKGSFYLYFRNKRELLLACFDRLCWLLVPLERWNAIRNEKDLFVKLRHRWVAGNEQYLTFAGVLNLLRASCFWDEEEVKENAIRAYDVIVAPIRKDLIQAIAEGIIRPMDVELASYVVLWIMEGLSFRLHLDSRFSNEEGADFFHSFLRSALENRTCQVVEEVAQTLRATITDTEGSTIELADLSFGGLPYLVGKFGDAEITVDLTRLSTIKTKVAHSKRIALLSAKNGQEMSLEMDGNILITGDTPFGGLQIPFESVSRISFQVDK
jgi:AcrR family transcriptional regulator